jgi:hypothetical protein
MRTSFVVVVLGTAMMAWDPYGGGGALLCLLDAVWLLQQEYVL